jgi:integral membrane protein (TIGR01906 family)
MGARLGAGLVATAAALVLLGASILPFLTPAYVRLEQDRTGVPALTGYGPAQLDAVDAALLSDLVLWRGGFTVAVNGTPMLNDREQAHMLDVRGVFAGLFGLVAVGAVILAVAFGRTRRDAEARIAAWRAIGSGARGLAISIAVLGVVAVLAFDAAFEVFHRLFFSSGTYTFDPRTDRLVQLFPEQFWSETAIAVGGVALAAAILTALLAARRAAVGASRPAFAPSRVRP